MKKINYQESPTQDLPQQCEVCSCEISQGDECYYMGDGVYICSSFTDDCLKKWEN